VHDEVLGLFIDLEASHDQLDATFLYTSSRHGTATLDLATPGTDLKPLFQAILDHVPAPAGDPAGPFQMLISTLDHSPFLGRLGIGRVERGVAKVGESVAVLPLGEPGMVPEGEGDQSRITRLYTFDGLARIEVSEVPAGDICVVSGFDGIEIGKTLTDPGHRERLLGIAVEEPTISVDVIVNNSPFAGREGKYVTSRQVKDRLYKELERNVALKVEETDSPDTHTVSGRGELHLGILMETMRREGFEFQVSRPRVITRVSDTGERLEPYEELMIDVAEEYMGPVMEKLGPRRAEMTEMRNPGMGLVRLVFKIPSRGLFGYRSEFLTDTRGTGTMHHRFLAYGPWAGPLAGRKRGVLVADREGSVVGFALGNLQERAQMFVAPGEQVYEGMVVGENSRPGDMDVNVTKEKKLSNMRTTATDENIQLEPPRQITLEYALEYIEEDELIEVTPENIRLRKRMLAAVDRRKAARAAARIADAS
jgi:GTP-binding protein